MLTISKATVALDMACSGKVACAGMTVQWAWVSVDLALPWGLTILAEPDMMFQENSPQEFVC